MRYAFDLRAPIARTDFCYSLFETTIRYVGGFISAYELSGYRYPVLIKKAKEIADYLVHGFDGVRVISFLTDRYV